MDPSFRALTCIKTLLKFLFKFYSWCYLGNMGEKTSKMKVGLSKKKPGAHRNYGKTSNHPPRVLNAVSTKLVLLLPFFSLSALSPIQK